MSMESSSATRALSDTSVLHPRIAELIDELDDARVSLHAALGAISDERKRADAAHGAWSIAQIVEHLGIVEDGAGRVVSKIIAGVRAAGHREEDASSILGANDAFRIATTDQRIEAPPFTRPTGLALEAAIEKLEAARDRLKLALRDASGLALGAATYPHPVFGAFTAYQWTLATAQHERRHIRQIRRLAGLGDA